MRGSRGNSGSGADPRRIVDQDAELFAAMRRQRAARERADDPDVTVIPVDMIGDPEAAREAIRAKYGDRLAP